MALTNASKGDYAELRVLADLVQRGYIVSIPYGHARYDLIADKAGQLLRVQVKHAHIFRDAVIVKCNSSPNGSKDIPYKPGEIDLIAAYEPTTDTVYYVPFELAKGNSRAVSLRLKASRNNQMKGTRMASLFLTPQIETASVID